MNLAFQLIQGKVSSLTIHNGEAEYVLSSGQRTAGVGTAGALALEGLAGAAAGAGLASSSGGDSVEFFSCRIDGQSVIGRFSKVTFKDGDAVDMVVSPQLADEPQVLAARRRADQVLWMVPHCSRGSRSHRAFSTWLAGKLLLILLLGGMVFVVLMQYLHGQSQLVDWFSTSIIGVMAVIAAPYYAIRFYGQWLPIACQAEQIFSVLGYPDPSRVNLPRDHKRFCKSKGIRWPYNVNNGADAGAWIYHYLDPKDAESPSSL